MTVCGSALPLHGDLQLGTLHAVEWAQGWQYAHTHHPADEEWPDHTRQVCRAAAKR